MQLDNPHTQPLKRIHAQVIGAISGSGRITLEDRLAPPGSPPPVDLDLEKVAHHLYLYQPKALQSPHYSKYCCSLKSAQSGHLEWTSWFLMS